MKIHTLWTYYDEGREVVPSLVLAWDEATIEANPEGWEKDKEEHMAEFSDRATRDFREIVVNVPNLWDYALARLRPGSIAANAMPKEVGP